MIEFERLIDHHCHGIMPATLARPRIEAILSESHRPVIPGVTQFDKPVGLILRRFCAPVLGLEPFAEPEDYVARRTKLGGEEASRRLMQAAGVGTTLIDTGHRGDEILDVPQMAALAGCTALEVVRIEAVMEEAARSAENGTELIRAFDALLHARAAGSIALKSIVAYRTTFDIDQTRPTPAEAATAGDAWLLRNATTGWRRLEDAVLIRHALFTALDICAERRFPLQLHVGVGDVDVKMPKCDPTVFIPFVLQAEQRDVPITLLHCYPFLQESTWMAEVFSNVYFDVGFTMNFTGPMARKTMEDALEMGPFFKQLYSSDAFGLAELHLLGAIQFKRFLSAILSDWVGAGECSARDADRIAAMISHENAARIYRL